MFDLPQVVNRLSHVGYNFLNAFYDFGRSFFFTSIEDATEHALEDILDTPLDSWLSQFILRIFDYIDGDLTMFELVVVAGLWLIAIIYIVKFILSIL